jgi:hypothetical protein
MGSLEECRTKVTTKASRACYKAEQTNSALLMFLKLEAQGVPTFSGVTI